MIVMFCTFLAQEQESAGILAEVWSGCVQVGVQGHVWTRGY